MARLNPRRRLSLAVVDRSGMAGTIEALARANDWPIELLACASSLEVLAEGTAPNIGALVVSVAAAGPFLPDLLRWSDGNGSERTPVLVMGSNAPDDDTAARLVVSREHATWLDSAASETSLKEWLEVAVEVHALRLFRREHDAIAGSLREARGQVFHGFHASYTAPSEMPCGPPLPTSIDEIQPLKDARTQFERSHIQAAVREFGSLKDAAVALGISYTSLWRRLR
jgi:hypothetical protein